MKLRNKPSEAYQNMKAEAMELRAFFDNTHNDSDEHDIMTDVWRFPITIQRKETMQAATQHQSRSRCASGHSEQQPAGRARGRLLRRLRLDAHSLREHRANLRHDRARTEWCDVIVRRYIKTTGDNNVRCVRQGRELPREEIAAIFE